MKQHVAKGNTVFFSSHNLDLVKRLCDRCAVVNRGELVDFFDLKDNEENKKNLEERFFKITGTYDERVFKDYSSQELSYVNNMSEESADVVEEQPKVEEENKEQGEE